VNRTATRIAPDAETEGVILQTRELSKVYGGVAALQGVDFALKTGELHCIIGPNGAGKSTFFKLIMGIERPSSGKIIFKGRDITRLQPHERARLGITVKFQNMRVYQDLPVYHNLFIPLRRHHRPREIPAEVERLLVDVHLTGTAEEYVRNLSHGQQQWLAIAMAVAADPEVLLLDEPTAGMSLEETVATARIVKQLNGQGTSIIVIEHDMAFIRDLDAMTSVLHYGSLFAQGQFKDIETNLEVQRIYLGTL
jgi:branched-chain amino acid transport system ATP-binding protein